MNTGLFCNYENHHQDVRRAIFEQVLLIKQAENLGFEEAWVSEHHVSESNLSPSMLLLMAHLAGVTSTIRLGTGTVLLPFHHPIRVAEDIATLDNLCSERLMFGIAEGGPFPEQNKHFGVSIKDSRVRMLAAIQIMQNSPHPQKSYDQTNICDEVDYLLENSIIGDVQTCRDKIKKFQDELNLSTIALKPSSLSLQKNIESLQRYNQKVRNYV